MATTSSLSGGGGTGGRGGSSRKAAAPGMDDLFPETADEPAARQDEALRAWVGTARELGLPAQQQVWEIHAIQGRNLADTASLLELPLPEVTRLRTEARTEAAARMPKGELDRAALREQLWDMLMATCAATCGSRDPRLLALRVKCVDQMTRLHGLNMDPAASATDAAAPPYSATDEERDALQHAAADRLYQRGGDVIEIRERLRQPRETPLSLEDSRPGETGGDESLDAGLRLKV